MAHPHPRSTRDLIGGRWAVSLRGFAVICVVIVVPTILVPTVPTWSPAAKLVAFLAEALCAAVIMMAADRTVFRHRHRQPLPVFAVVLLGAAMGAVRVITLSLAPLLIEAPTPTTPQLIRLGIVSIVALGALYPTLVYVLAARDWYTSERTRLIARDVQATSDRLRAAGALDATLDSTLAAIELRLREARSSTTDLMAAPDPDANAIAAGLLEAARSSMRPLSHDLWAAAPTPYPAVRWHQVMASEIRHQPLPILAPTIGFVAIFIPGTIGTLGVIGCLTTALVAVVSIAVAFRLGRVAVRRNARLALPVALAAVIAAALPISLVASIGFAASPARILQVVLLLAGLVVTTGVAGALRETSDVVVRDLARLVKEKELEQIALIEADERLRRDIAAYLHGTVQSDLISASVALRNAARSADAIAYQQASASALAALELQYDPKSRSAEMSLVELVEAADRDWSGILDLTWELPSREIPSSLVPSISTVLRESLANAMVHGNASHASVRIARTAAIIDVVVSDDGDGPQHGDPGLGSALLDDATGHQWSLTVGPSGGAELHATFAI